MGIVKRLCIFAALWHAGSSIALPGVNSPLATSVRQEDSSHHLHIRDTNVLGPILQSRGIVRKETTQPSPGNAPSQSQASSHSDSQHEKSSTSKRDRWGIPFSPPPLRSLKPYTSLGTIGNPAGKPSLSTSVKAASLRTDSDAGTVASGHGMEQSISRASHRDSGFPDTKPSSPIDHQNKDRLNDALRMPPPPPRPVRDVVMGYPVDSIDGNNWASHYFPAMKRTKSSNTMDTSRESGSASESHLTRRSVLLSPTNLQASSNKAPVSLQGLLVRRGCSPSWQCGPVGDRKPTKIVTKGPSIPEQPRPLQPTHTPRVRFWLPGNIATRTSQPLSGETQRRPGLDLGGQPQSESSKISGRKSPVRSMFETPEYFKNSWRSPHTENNPTSDESTSSPLKSTSIQRRSILNPRTAGRESHPKSPPRPPSTSRAQPVIPNFAANHRTFAQIFPTAEAQSIATDPVAEEALSNAAARARQYINPYPPIDRRLPLGRVTTPDSPRASFYPRIPAPPVSGLPNGLANGLGNLRLSDSDSPGKATLR